MHLRKLGSSLMVERRLEQRKLGSLAESGSLVSQLAKPKTELILLVSITSDSLSIDTLHRLSWFGQFGWVMDSPKFNISKSNTTTSSTQNGQPRPNLHKLKTKMFTIHNNQEKSTSNTYWTNINQKKKPRTKPIKLIKI